jgi:hypothetical protein
MDFIYHIIQKNKTAANDPSSESSIKFIENMIALFTEAQIFEPANSAERYCVGYYYKMVKENHIEMLKHYTIGANDGNIDCIVGLSFYYNSQKNYPLMKKYYLLGVDQKESSSINNLAFYYLTIEKNYKAMKKLYLMNLEKGYPSAMNGLGYYYSNIKKKYTKGLKYYKMGAATNDETSICNLADYYNVIEKNDTKVKICCKYGINKNSSMCLNYLIAYLYNTHQYNLMAPYYNKLIKLKCSDGLEIFGKYHLFVKCDIELYDKCLKIAKIFNNYIGQVQKVIYD